MFNKVLVLSPHTDDAEVGCGGLISHLVQLHKQVVVYVYSLSITGNLKENEDSLNFLNISLREFFNYPDTKLCKYRQDILDHLLLTKEPDLVLVPATYDCHQDHQTITQEAIRAFKYTTILGYDFPWNHVLPSHITTFFPLNDLDFYNKIRSLSFYESQQNKPYFDQFNIESIAIMRGMQCGHKLAEAFETIRWIIDAN